MTNIIISGCNGKMGKVIESIIAARDNATVVAGVDFFDQPNDKFPVYKTISDCKEKADVIIDFSGGLFASFINYIIYSFKNKKINKNFSSEIIAK